MNEDRLLKEKAFHSYVRCIEYRLGRRLSRLY